MHRKLMAMVLLMFFTGEICAVRLSDSEVNRVAARLGLILPSHDSEGKPLIKGTKKKARKTENGNDDFVFKAFKDRLKNTREEVKSLQKKHKAQFGKVVSELKGIERQLNAVHVNASPDEGSSSSPSLKSLSDRLSQLLSDLSELSDFSSDDELYSISPMEIQGDTQTKQRAASAGIQIAVAAQTAVMQKEQRKSLSYHYDSPCGSSGSTTPFSYYSSATGSNHRCSHYNFCLPLCSDCP